MKKKNVVKKEVREKKTHVRTAVKIQTKKTVKPVEKVETKSAKSDAVGDKEIARKPRKAPKPVHNIETVEPQQVNIENNEQNI